MTSMTVEPLGNKPLAQRNMAWCSMQLHKTELSRALQVIPSTISFAKDRQGRQRQMKSFVINLHLSKCTPQSLSTVPYWLRSLFRAKYKKKKRKRTKKRIGPKDARWWPFSSIASICVENERWNSLCDLNRLPPSSWRLLLTQLVLAYTYRNVRIIHNSYIRWIEDNGRKQYDERQPRCFYSADYYSFWIGSHLVSERRHIGYEN